MKMFAADDSKDKVVENGRFPSHLPTTNKSIFKQNMFTYRLAQSLP